MKSFAYLVPAFAGLALAYPQHGGHDMPKGGHEMPKGGMQGGHGMPAGGHGMPDGGHGGKGMMEHAGHGAPPAKTSNIGKIEQIKPLFNPTNKRVKVTYGRYSLVGFNSAKDADHEGGMANASNKKAPKPCSDCTLKHAKVALTYPDGKTANYATGAWLHHLTLAVVGPSRSDVACPGGTMRIPKNMERMLAVHNDRNETFFGLNGADKAGFYLGKDDEMDLELVLKNEVNIPLDVDFTIEWEYVPGKPQGWKNVKGIWMDVAPCSAMGSDINVPKDKKKFTVDGPEWVSTVSGKLLNTVGHMHDGGVAVNIHINGKTVCSSKAQYGTTPDYVVGPEAIKNGAKDTAAHISRYTPCNDIGPIKKGDKVKVTADYDVETYKPALNKLGEESHVMGLALVFIELDS